MDSSFLTEGSISLSAVAYSSTVCKIFCLIKQSGAVTIALKAPSWAVKPTFLCLMIENA